jgi:hypothetical protein
MLQLELPRLSQTSWSALYLITSMYVVCLSNSLTDDWNPNSHLPVERRQVLPDPLLHYVERVASALMIRRHGDDGIVVITMTWICS